MQKLVNGYKKFQTEIFGQKKALFEELAGEQNPRALFVTCADSRVLPDLITQADPGELFICRNAGNIIPPYGERLGGVSATIEYAILALDVRHIIVCGHSDCGAMRAILEPKRMEKMPTVSAWLHHGELAKRIVEETYVCLNEHDKLHALTKENVLAQLDHLKTHPSVAARSKRGDLKLYGWYYEIHTGDVEAYDVETETWVPLDPACIPVAVESSLRFQKLRQSA